MSEEIHKFKYLTQNWMEEVEKRVKATLTAEDMKHVTSSMMNIYQNCPDGKIHYLYFKFVNGQLAEILSGDETEEVANKTAEFRILGNYDIFAKISRAELGARSALMRGKIKLKGNMVKALRLSSVVDKLNKVIATIPTEF